MNDIDHTAYCLRIGMTWDLITLPHRMNITNDLLSIIYSWDTISQNMFLATHLLLIDGDSLVLNMQY